MLVSLFGDYLLKTNKITKEQLQEVIVSMSKSRVKLGHIAVAEKLITKEQSDVINRKQAVLDKRFGDIAIELGYLTGDQVSHLLDMQGNTYMLMSQTITELGLMSMEEFDQALNEYAESNQLGIGAVTALKSDDIDKIVPLFLFDMDNYAKDLTAVVFRTLNRLISGNISMDKATLIKEYKSTNMTFQCMEGDCSIFLSFNGTDDALLFLGGAFAREEFETVDLDVLDSIAEFTNIINGLYATALSYRKISVELQAPEMFIEEHKVPVMDLWNVPFSIDGKEFNLILKVTRN